VFEKHHRRAQIPVRVQYQHLPHVYRTACHLSELFPSSPFISRPIRTLHTHMTHAGLLLYSHISSLAHSARLLAHDLRLKLHNLIACSRPRLRRGRRWNPLLSESEFGKATGMSLGGGKDRPVLHPFAASCKRRDCARCQTKTVLYLYCTRTVLVQ
jgi:hypothetical protein